VPNRDDEKIKQEDENSLNELYKKIKSYIITMFDKFKNISKEQLKNKNFEKIKDITNKNLDKFVDSGSKTRVITGLIMGGVVLLVLLIDSFFLMWLSLGAITYIAIDESIKMYKLKNGNNIYFIAGIIWFLALFYPRPFELIILGVILFASIWTINKLSIKEFYPILYPFSSMLFLLTLYVSNGLFAMLWLIIIVASCDTGAYYIGRAIGKNKFSKISPNKTIEGVIGGIAIATLLGTIVGIYNYSFLLSLVVALLVSTSSIFGDLFESYLKRNANIKDSGNILPGHGGVLDRLDGYLFGAVVMVLLLGAF
jgi:phosphatidate cytidylyltransferase